MKKVLTWIWFVIWILSGVLVFFNTLNLFSTGFRDFNNAFYILCYLLFMAVFFVGLTRYLNYKNADAERREYEEAKEYIAKIEAEKQKEKLS